MCTATVGRRRTNVSGGRGRWVARRNRRQNCDLESKNDSDPCKQHLLTRCRCVAKPDQLYYSFGAFPLCPTPKTGGSRAIATHPRAADAWFHWEIRVGEDDGLRHGHCLAITPARNGFQDLCQITQLACWYQHAKQLDTKARAMMDICRV